MSVGSGGPEGAWGDGEGFDVSSGVFSFGCLSDFERAWCKADGHFILDSRGPIALFVVHGHTAQSYPRMINQATVRTKRRKRKYTDHETFDESFKV